MSGLAAVVINPRTPATSMVERMLDGMTHYPWLTPVLGQPGAEGVALGVVTLPHMATSACVTARDGQRSVVLHGELFDADAERHRLTGAGVSCSDGSHAALLLAGWIHEGAPFLARLNGEFLAVIWDGARRELSVITDRFGLRPVYVAMTAAGFVAASEIKAVLQLPGVDTSWSEAGVAQFFAFGHFFGDDTLLRGVRAVPAATVGTYRLGDSTYEERRYWHLTPRREAAREDDLAAAFEERFVAAVERRARPGERLGLSLSGGLDARTILGVVPAGVDLKTVSLGIEGSLDHRSASAMSALAGVPHRSLMLDADFLSTFETSLRRMVQLTDGHYLDQGIVMTTMAVYRELGIDYLMRGHGGELLHMRKAYAFSLDEAALRASEDEIERWLLSHLTAYMLDGVPDDLFTVDVRALASASLRKALARCDGATEPVDRVWALFLNERLHRETPLSLHLFGCFATIRQPYLDNDVIDALFAMPARLKIGDELQTTVLRRRRPAFLDITNANTGARLGAGPLATELSRFRLRVFAKLGVKGYQPYERLGLWLKRELRPFVERTLTGEALLESGLVRADAVQRLAREHFDGRANHTFLLMSLLICSLGLELRQDPGCLRR